MVKKTERIPINARALTQRISRKLPDGQVLHATRNKRARAMYGDWILIKRGEIIEHHIDLEELGRRTGALQTWEALSDE